MGCSSVDAEPWEEEESEEEREGAVEWTEEEEGARREVVRGGSGRVDMTCEEEVGGA